MKAKTKISGRDEYVERVKRALETDPSEMPRVDYIDALEELAADVDGMLEAAREELEAEGK